MDTHIRDLWVLILLFLPQNTCCQTNENGERRDSEDTTYIMHRRGFVYKCHEMKWEEDSSGVKSIGGEYHCYRKKDRKRLDYDVKHGNLRYSINLITDDFKEQMWKVDRFYKRIETSVLQDTLVREFISCLSVKEKGALFADGNVVSFSFSIDGRGILRDMEIRMKRPFRGCLSRKTFLRFRKILLKRRFPVIAQDEDLYVQIGFGIPWVIRYEELGLE